MTTSFAYALSFCWLNSTSCTGDTPKEHVGPFDQTPEDMHVARSAVKGRPGTKPAVPDRPAGLIPDTCSSDSDSERTESRSRPRKRAKWSLVMPKWGGVLTALSTWSSTPQDFVPLASRQVCTLRSLHATERRPLAFNLNPMMGDFLSKVRTRMIGTPVLRKLLSLGRCCSSA